MLNLRTREEPLLFPLVYIIKDFKEMSENGTGRPGGPMGPIGPEGPAIPCRKRQIVKTAL